MSIKELDAAKKRIAQLEKTLEAVRKDAQKMVDERGRKSVFSADAKAGLLAQAICTLEIIKENEK